MKKTWVEIALAVAVTIGGAALGTTIGADRAEASVMMRTGWKCISMDDCGPGTKKCCYQTGESGHVACSTNCSIIVNP